ncbi:MAG TPA: hypothetical protein VMH79_08225 [Thermoanaerobaculia bacterium]|nr:hypothetical protein [Thermoanaerobaculia bacterium]
MAQISAAAACLVFAAAGVYVLCRELCCARLPAAFGAAAWTLSEALLSPGAPRGASGAASLLVPFAVAGAFSREKRRRPFLLLAAACLVWRWRSGPSAAGPAALEALVLAVLAAFGAQRLWDGEGGTAFVVGAGAAAIAALCRHEPALGERLLEVLPTTAALVAVALTPRAVRARAGLVALVALFGAVRGVEIARGPRAGGAVMASAAAGAPFPRR